MTQWSRGGFTLAEVVLGAMALSVAMAAILGAYIGQLTLNEHARNLSLAIQDANRVIEQIRQQNSPCAGGTTAPTALPPAPYTSLSQWDDWLYAAPGSKSIQPVVPATPKLNELVVVTAQNRDGTANWVSGDNPIRVTAAVCWRHRNRTIGECTWNGTSLAANESLSMPSDSSAIDSPAMLMTLVTCR